MPSHINNNAQITDKSRTKNITYLYFLEVNEAHVNDCRRASALGKLLNNNMPEYQPQNKRVLL